MEESILPGQSSPPPITRRRTRVFQMLNSLAAVLVLGAIVGTLVLLFSHGPHSEPGTGGTDGTILAAHSAAGGLEMSLYLTPGPYFLSEMLAADVSLTNHTNKTYYVGIPFVGSSCGYVTDIIMTGGGAPHYTIPIATQHSCPASFNGTSLKPGQTITVRKYLPLTDSGRVMLTAQTTFFTKNANNGFSFNATATGSLAGHWPSVKIDVNSKVPANRKLSFRIIGTHVLVTAPSGVHFHLVYLYGIWCTDAQHSGIGITGNYGWEPISKNQVSLPACPAGSEVHWTFAFGAPGYAIAVGNYPPTANHT